MLSQLPHDAPQHARAQPRDPMRSHDHHRRVSLARDFEPGVSDVDVIRHRVRFRVKRESPRQLGPLGGDPRGVLVLQAIDRRHGRRVGGGSVLMPNASGEPPATAPSPGS